MGFLRISERGRPRGRGAESWALVTLATLGVVSLTAAGCPSSGEADGVDAGSDAPAVFDWGGPEADPWTVTEVAQGPVGRQIDLVILPSGEPAVAYFATEGVEDGPCTEIADDPPMRVRWPLSYAQRGADGTWAVERVDDVLLLGIPQGLDLEVAPSGAPTIATMTGQPVAQIRYCGANDVGLYTRQGAGDWPLETAVATSGQAATGEPASDYGDVVGYWPSLAFDADGNPAIAYKDVHAGGMQSDDFRRADLELAWRRGGWQALPVDWGHGAGDYNALVFDEAGRPNIVYHNPTDDVAASQHGLWVARSADGGATWERVQLLQGKTLEHPDAVLHEGQLVVAYYDALNGLPYIARLVDDAAFTDLAAGWEVTEIGDHRYDEGVHPSLAVSPRGQLAVAYYRCTRATDGLGACKPTHDGVIFAYEDGGEWTREEVDLGGSGDCGRWPSLGFLPDGRAVVAYQCVEQQDDGAFVPAVRAATREALP